MTRLFSVSYQTHFPVKIMFDSYGYGYQSGKQKPSTYPVLSGLSTKSWFQKRLTIFRQPRPWLLNTALPAVTARERAGRIADCLIIKSVRGSSTAPCGLFAARDPHGVLAMKTARRERAGSINRRSKRGVTSLLNETLCGSPRDFQHAKALSKVMPTFSTMARGRRRVRCIAR